MKKWNTAKIISDRSSQLKINEWTDAGKDSFIKNRHQKIKAMEHFKSGLKPWNMITMVNFQTPH